MAELSPYLVFQPPPRVHLHSFNRSLPASQQPPSIPQTFLDALSIREQVFVTEQKAVPLKHHTDTDDARSCHWVLYLPPSSPSEKPKPIGTIRLVPSPHAPHPEPGSKYDVPPDDSIESQGAEEVFFAPDPVAMIDRPTDFYDGAEPYVKLGRLCVVKEERGRKVADLLIQGALEWAREHVEEVRYGMCGAKGYWRGLVCLHAQEGAVRVWARNGFVVDGRMGKWSEAAKRHVEMWLRVDLGGK